MTSISLRTIAQALYDVTHNADEATTQKTIKKTVRYLARHGMISQSNDFIEHVRKTFNTEQAITQAHVISQQELSAPDITKITTELGKRFPETTIELIPTIDPDVIGGLKIIVGDRVIDYSLAGKVDQLRHHLMSNT